MKKIEYSLWALLIVLVVLYFINLDYLKGIPFFTIIIFATIGTLYMALSSIHLNALSLDNVNLKVDLSLISKFRIRISGYFGYVFMFLIYSVLLKIMFWPGRDILAQIGIIGSLVGIIFLFFFEKDRQSILFRRIVNRTIFIGVFADFFILFLLMICLICVGETIQDSKRQKEKV